jgi:hypothetical protein
VLVISGMGLLEERVSLLNELWASNVKVCPVFVFVALAR